MSDKPWEINCDRALLFSDVHLDVAWARAVIEHETGNFDQIMFCGDLFDSRKSYPAIVSTRAAARFYRELIERKDTVVLLGNHDTPVMESWSHNQKFSKKIPLLNPCSGFSNHSSIDANKELTWEHWRKVGLFRVVNGWLVSHAGVNSAHMRPYLTDEENLRALWEDAESALEMIQFKTHPLLACGRARGGDAYVPGLTWQDWSFEFYDDLPWPQICGHTFDPSVRKLGRSYCIDTGQKSYALISRDETVQFKNLVRAEVSGTWVEEPAVVEEVEDRK